MSELNCPKCAFRVDQNSAFCPNCGAAMSPGSDSGADGCGAIALGLVAGISVDLMLFFCGGAALTASGGRCPGKVVVFMVLLGITIAIPIVALVRSRDPVKKEGGFWGGFVVATFLPFLPCSLMITGSNMAC